MDIVLQSLSNLLSNKLYIKDLVAYACEEILHSNGICTAYGTLVKKYSVVRNTRSNVLPQTERKKLHRGEEYLLRLQGGKITSLL
jgi:hypothetical protein